MSMTPERITPAKAREYLESNTDNYRKPRKHRIEQYARDMRRGSWGLTGEAIKFGVDGALEDGQNRLMACVAAGKPFRSYVVRDIPKGANLFMDSGASRSFTDHLAKAGFSRVTALAAALRWCVQYEAGSAGRHGSVSHAELWAYLEEHPELEESVTFVCNHAVPFRGTNIPLIGIRHFTRNLPGEFDAFHEQLRTGGGLDEGDPIFALRRWLEWANIRAIKPRPKMCQAVVIKAWNAWLEGASMHTLTWRGGGARPEAFPTIANSMPGEDL